MEEIEINDEILNDGGYDGVWPANDYDDASIDVVEELPGVDNGIYAAASDTKQRRKRSVVIVVLIAVAALLVIATGLSVGLGGNKNTDVSSVNKMSSTSLEDCLEEEEALGQQLEEKEMIYIVSEEEEEVEYDLEEEGSKYSSDGDYGVELETTYYVVSEENDESPADYVGSSGDSNDGIDIELIRRDLRGGSSTADKVEIERKIKRDRVCIVQLYICR